MSRRRVDVPQHLLPPTYGSPPALPGLLAFATPGRVLFGSDRPYAPSIAVTYFTGQLDAHAPLDDAGYAAIARGNAELLFTEVP